MTGKPRSFRCPQCHEPFLERTAAFPFCGMRCRMLDLSGWLDEEFRVSRPLIEGDDDSDNCDRREDT